MSAVKDKTWFLREGLFAKYVVSLVGLVVFVLAVNGAMETWISYRGTRVALVEAMGEKADATARRIEQSIFELERQISWVTRASATAANLDRTMQQRRADYAQLLNQLPAVSQLSFLSGAGRELLRMSRTQVVTDGDADFARDVRFIETNAKGVTFAPVYFVGSRPFMSIAVSHSGVNAGVTLAEIDLRFLNDFLGEAQIGKVGYAYVVDARGQVLAGSKGPEVAKELATLPQVAALLKPDGVPLTSGTGFDGERVLTAASAVPKLGWHVLFEQPTAQALAPIRDQLVRSALLIGLGLVVAILAGTVLARRMLIPITALRAGARRLGAGDFSHRIEVRTKDELEELSDQFNSMAGQLQETYAGLESKVEARTRDLARSINELKVLEEVGRAVASSLDLNAVLPTVAARALEITHADAVLIYGHDAAKHQFNLTEAIGIDKAAGGKHLVIDESGSVLGEAAAQGEPIAIPDLAAATENRLRDAVMEAGFHSVLVVPLVDQKGILGSLVVLRKIAGEFSPDLIGLMKTFAHQSVLAMRNARLFSEVDAEGPRTRHGAFHRAAASGQAAGADRRAEALEQVAGGASRKTARRDRAHSPAGAFPAAASGAADRLFRRPRFAARQPPPRGHGGVLRPQRLHGVHRDHRAGRSDERAARISRRARRIDLPLRRHARPLCRRRRDDPVQRADPVR